MDQDNAVLLEALSARLRKQLPQAWPRLFGDTGPVVDFEAEERTLVCAHATRDIGERDAHALRSEAAWLAKTLGGRVEPAGSSLVLAHLGRHAPRGR